MICEADVPGRGFPGRYSQHPGWIFYNSLVVQAVQTNDIMTAQGRNRAMQFVLAGVTNKGGRFLNVECTDILDHAKTVRKINKAILHAHTRLEGRVKRSTAEASGITQNAGAPIASVTPATPATKASRDTLQVRD